ncbi:MAG: hypothetical protein NTU93_07350 [Arthrobacter sp.]|nr:hypothetical protein [Arthrobacter sp.]
MKGKFLFGTGLAAGYVLGSRSGRAAYEKLKTRAIGLWDSKPVQDKVAASTEAVKEKAPDVSSQLGEAARRAATVISSAVHRDDGAVSGAAAPVKTPAAAGTPFDVGSDPALNDEVGRDWSDEGGATPAGPATNVDQDKH